MAFQITALAIFAGVFAICSIRKVHIGIFMFPIACGVGMWLAHLPLDDVVAGFPLDILVLLVGVTYFFAIAQVNGTIEGLINIVISKVGSHPAALPVAFFCIAAVVSSMGSPLASLVLAPIALPMAKRFAIDPMLMAVALGCGGASGSFAPTSLFGIVTYGTAKQADIPISPFAPLLVSLGMNLVLFIGAYFVFGGRTLISGSRSSDMRASVGSMEVQQSPTSGPLTTASAEKVKLTGMQWLTCACILILGLGVIALTVSRLGANLGVLAFAFGAFLTFIDPDSGKATIPKIDWSTVLLVGGIITFVEVLQTMGAVDLLGDGASKIGSTILAAFIICFIGGLVSAFASTTGILAALVPLALPLVATGEVSGWALICSLAVCSSIVDLSPFSTVGATFVAMTEESQKERVTRLLIRWGLTMVIVGPVVLVGLLVLPASLLS